LIIYSDKSSKPLLSILNNWYVNSPETIPMGFLFHATVMQSTACPFGWWLVLVCYERKVLLAGCWWLVCSERKVLLAGG
jgi:hypothetical protein